MQALINAPKSISVPGTTKPETSSFPVSEAAYTANATDPTPEPSDEDPFGEPQRFPTPKRRGNNGITKRRSKTKEGQAQMP